MPDGVYDVKTLTPFSPPSAATAILLLEDGTAFYGTGFGGKQRMLARFALTPR